MAKRGATLKKIGRRPLIAVVVVVVLLFVSRIFADPPPATSGSAAPAPPKPTPQAPPFVKAPEDIANIEDPVTLIRAGKLHLEDGNEELAQKCFEAAAKKHEVNLYGHFAGKPYAKAYVLELMGKMDEAEAAWMASFDKDLVKTFHRFAHFSTHPKRAEIINNARERIAGWVEKVKAGEKVQIYTTKKGAPRYLEPIEWEEAEEAFLNGQKLRYKYFDVLDLKKRKWPKSITCQRCVVGKVLAWDADFEEDLKLVLSIVLDEFHVGKKWKGKIGASSFEPASRFNRLYIGDSLFLGSADFDSVKVTGRLLNAPFAVFMGNTNFRNARLGGVAEFRLAHFETSTSFKSAHFDSSAYFSYTHFKDLDLSRALVRNRQVHFANAKFKGSLLVEDANFHHGITFENAKFAGDVTFRRNSFDDQLNFSRISTTGNFVFRRNEVKDLLMYGGEVFGDTQFDSNVFLGRSSFSPDELTRRQHLEDVDPLHKLYKLYQGDDDAEEDLTSKAQYGVTNVDDLVSRFHGNISFANSYFKQFVAFERVAFGTEGKSSIANFYNTQFGGEAHFERARFYGVADFRTIGGLEVTFNQAHFFKHLMLDDANIPGRLSLTEARMGENGTVSLTGADIRSFDIGNDQLLRDVDEIWRVDGHLLFYERCIQDLADNKNVEKYLNDSRFVDAKWDERGENRLTDEAEIVANIEDLCINRTVDEFTRLRDSFEGRSMANESDWAYWHLKHYINYRRGHRSFVGGIVAFIEQAVFEKAFGWGVLLSNLLATAMVVVLFFAVLMRIFCAEMEVVWDGEPTRYKELSPFALLVISMHSFLGGFGNSEALVTDATSTYKFLFTTEIIVGIIVITFFIGAYTRMVLGGG